MFIESLAKLTLIYEECKQKGIVIESEQFMNDTKEVIDKEIALLQEDAKFYLENPGPHIFGFGKLEICIFSPQYTQDGTWVMATKQSGADKIDETFKFNTIPAFLKNLISVCNEENKIS
jgi:hypothetical protein